MSEPVNRLKPLLQQDNQVDTPGKNPLWAPLAKAFHRLASPIILDTLTTRFLMLFLMLLSIPLGSIIIFSVSLLTTHMDKESNNQVIFSQNVFDAALDELGNRLSGTMPGQGMGELGPLSRQFETSNNRLYFKVRQFIQDDTLSKTLSTGSIGWSKPFIIDDVFLNRIYRRHPNLQTKIWILSLSQDAQPQPDSHAALPRKPLWLAQAPAEPSDIPAADLLEALEHAGANSFGQLLTLEVNHVSYRIIQEPIYSMQHEKIARVIHILPLVSNQILLSHYYLGLYGIAVVSLVCAVLLAMLAGRTITQPLLRLIREVDTLSRGSVMKESDGVLVSGVYEIRQMGEAFNRMVKRLRQEHTLRDEFVATLTHDLKVPLLAEKQTLAYFLRRTYGPLSEEQAEVLDILQSSNGACLSLVNGLLEVYRYDSGTVPLLLERFNIWSLLDETVNELQVLAQDKNLLLTLDASPDALTDAMSATAFVYADRMEIKRILHNLISNAIINTAPHGAIRCQLTDCFALGNPSVFKRGEFRYSTLKVPLKTENRLLVTIQDSGVGFPKEELPNLFQRFAASRIRNPMSIGLGLYNCYQVILAHSGLLWVDTTEGEGSAVSFLLPCTSSTAQERRIRYDRRTSSR